LSDRLLIDDHLLLRVLLGDEPKTLRRGPAAIATTGLWYHRLCRALAGPAVVGAFSSRLGGVDDATAEQVLAAVVELPESVELLSLRELAWPMGELVQGGARLNLLALEALAAARHSSAEICLARADDNRSLRDAAQALRVPVRLIAA
jgi:hypothetical protein